MNIGNNMSSALYIRTKRKKLKWYKRILNYITGHKDRNWEWSLLSPTSVVSINER